ncbi:MAG TPA: rod shape-determining protein [Blastocatellia bacterium]|nr:rod shape-determining protein [Blastocatellia bacterium]
MQYQQVVNDVLARLRFPSADRADLKNSSNKKGMLTRAKERLQKLFSNDLVVDLGTSNTVIYVPDHGVVLNEPSVIAINNDTDQVVAVGREAKLALGRQANTIRIVRPLKDGVIADFDATEQMLSHFIKAALSRRKVSNPRILICAPGEISQVERRALEDAAGRAGARYVDVVEEPIAAAIGAGFDIQSGRIFMLVDIGGGTTDIAVLGYGGPVHLSTLRVGGDKMDEAIIQFVRHAHCTEIGNLTAEAIKLELSAAGSDQPDRDIEVRGRNLKTGLPAILKIPRSELMAAIEPVIDEIIQAICNSIEELSAEVSAGLLDSGIVLAGGASQFAGLAERIGRKTGIQARRASTDVQSVAVVGAGKLFRDGSYTSIRELMAQLRAEKLYDKNASEGDDYHMNRAA